MSKTLPLPAAQLRELAQQFGTPLYVYDASTLRARLAQLSGFDRVRYAQKANPNLAVLGVLRRAGVVVDAVSAGEIVRALRAGFAPEQVAYTADVFDPMVLELIARHALAVNCGSIDMLAQLARARAKAELTLRLNPGFGHGHDPRVSTGGSGSKHGIWHADFEQVLHSVRALGLSLVGLHVHIGSGSDLENLGLAASAFEHCAALVGQSLRCISAGGGLPIPYRPGERPFDVESYTKAWIRARERASARVGRRLELEVEPGRFLVAECGVLLARVLGTKRSGGLDYVLADPRFNTLLRPALYGAYHHISALSSEDPATRPTVVAGPLCESGDVFTQTKSGEVAPRDLPRLCAGDLLAIHDAGAYGMSMASRYNSQPLPAEVLVEDGVARLVRRRESFEDLLAHEEFSAD